MVETTAKAAFAVMPFMLLSFAALFCYPFANPDPYAPSFSRDELDKSESKIPFASTNYTSGIYGREQLAVPGPQGGQMYNLPKYFEFDDGFIFYTHANFCWDLPMTCRDVVLRSFVEIIDLLETTMKVLRPPGSTEAIRDNPSVLRYFSAPVDVKKVEAVFEVVLAILEAPNTEQKLACIDADQNRPDNVYMYYDDPSWMSEDGKLCGAGTTVNAYITRFHDPTTRNSRSERVAIVICPNWFQNFRRMNQVVLTELGPSIDPGTVAEPVVSGAIILLHELMHWKELINVQYFRGPANMIVDLVLSDVEEHRYSRAYRPFYSMKVKDPSWRPIYGNDDETWNLSGFKSIQNADCYVYTAVEIYYKLKKQAADPSFQDWTDPPRMVTYFPPGPLENGEYPPNP